MNGKNIAEEERMTSQKEIVLDYVKNTKCHPSAQKVYTETKRLLPRISKATVYRILNNFKDKGEIQEIAKINILKCNECFTENKALNNFRKCEVYSRVVGYIRPVEQWHKGKKQEFGERQEYIMPESNSFCC